MINEYYWIGWIYKYLNTKKISFVSGLKILHNPIFLMLYSAIIGLLLVAYVYCFNLKSTSVYNVYRDCKQGWAQQYALEWDARLTILHDDEIKDVCFEPLSVTPNTITYADLQTEDGYLWVNGACAAYYEKDSITVYSEETPE